jgi:hypothetical protein
MPDTPLEGMFRLLRATLMGVVTVGRRLRNYLRRFR